MHFRHVSLLLLAVFCLMSVPRAATPPPQSDNGIQALAEYFDNLASGNLESAGMRWAGSAQERSNRFGINFTGTVLRADCTSPVAQNINEVMPYLKPAAKSAQRVGSDFVKLEVNNLVDGKQIQWFYYEQYDNGYWWLTYPEDCYAQGWPVKESKYFRIHVHPDKVQYLNPAVLQEADAFVQRVCDSLKIDKSRVAEIASKKIEYFFCDNTETLTAITGQTTRGMLDQASNDVLSVDFPHFHEVVHLLVNIKLKNLPISTLPILREGIATRFGGRWGKRPSALMDLGAYLYDQKLVMLDSILTVSGFSTAAGADIAYPVAGDFCTYLSQRLGPSKFFEFYLKLSGSMEALDTLSQLNLEQQFATALAKKTWAEVVSDFEAYLKGAMPQMSVALAGAADQGTQLLKENRFEVTRDKDWLNFVFTTDSLSPQGSLVFGKDSRLSGSRSYLWDEQYGDSLPFDGYRYSVRYDQNEAGLYDYATNELVAKYIFGISTSQGYYDPGTGKIRIRFKSSLVGTALPTETDYRFFAK